jgi:hypothetical protein
MAGTEGKHNVRRPNRNSHLAEISSRPMKNGSGLEPRWSQEHYRGIPLTDDVASRIAEYRAYPSLTPAEIARMMR